MQEGVPGLTIELQSSNGAQSLGDAPPPPESMPQGKWTKQHVTLTASAGSHEARLAVTAAPGTSILLDQVSLWPSQNGPEGSISPFRPDLIQMVKDLNPRCCLLPLNHSTVQVPAGSVLWKNVTADQRLVVCRTLRIPGGCFGELFASSPVGL